MSSSRSDFKASLASSVSSRSTRIRGARSTLSSISSNSISSSHSNVSKALSNVNIRASNVRESTLSNISEQTSIHSNSIHSNSTSRSGSRHDNEDHRSNAFSSPSVSTRRPKPKSSSISKPSSMSVSSTISQSSTMSKSSSKSKSSSISQSSSKSKPSSTMSMSSSKSRSSSKSKPSSPMSMSSSKSKNSSISKPSSPMSMSSTVSKSSSISKSSSMAKQLSSYNYNTPTIQRLREKRLKVVKRSSNIKKRKLVAQHANTNVNANNNTFIQSQLNFQSTLRIRPFVPKEEEESEESIFSISDNATKLCMRKQEDKQQQSQKSRPSRSKRAAAKSEFHFDSILEDVNQEEVYDNIQGCEMIQSVMTLTSSMEESSVATNPATPDHPTEPNVGVTNHVLLSLGVSNSGKTYTMFGNDATRNDDDDDEDDTHMGIVPRLLQDLFFVGKYGKDQQQYREEEDSPFFAIEISMVHVYNDHVYDMLSHYKGDSKKKQPSRSNVLQMAESFENPHMSMMNRRLRSPYKKQQLQELRIHQDRQTQDFRIDPIVLSCTTLEEANDALQFGLKQNTISSTKVNSSSSRGHTLVSLQPVFSQNSGSNDDSDGDDGNDNDETNRIRKGGLITIIDMAGIERTKASAVIGSAMKESAAINSTISSVLQCLRCIKDNHAAAAQQNRQSRSSQSTKTSTNTHTSSSSSFTTKSKRQKAQIVPYRQNKLTMMMQPLFSGNIKRDQSGTSNNIVTNVKILVSAYPGMKDYNEKKSLFGQIDALRGLSVSSKKKRYEQDVVDEEEDSETDDESDSSSNNSLDPSINTQVTSPTESILSNTSSYSVIQKIDKNENINQTPISPPKTSPLKRLAANLNCANRGKRKRAIEEEFELLHKKIKTLEGEKNVLKKKNKIYKDRCQAFMLDNTNLKELLQDYQQKEEERQKTCINRDIRRERQLRRRRQNLLDSPFRDHVKKIERSKVLVTGTRADAYSKPSFMLKVPYRYSKPSRRSLEMSPSTPVPSNDNDGSENDL